MQREDLIVKFGGLRHPQPNLQGLTAVVAENENVRPGLLSRDLKSYSNGVMLSQKAISVLIRRSGTDGVTALRLIPRQGWGGRGSLGYASCFALHTRRLTVIHSCHLVPYASS